MKNLTTEPAKTKKRGRIFHIKYFIYDFLKWTGAIPTLIALRPRVYYIDKEAKKIVRKGALLVSNHQTYIDCVKLHIPLWYRRLHFVATKRLFNTKFKNWFFRRALCIPVDKENFNLSTFKEVCTVLDEGGVVAIFPEGGINHDGGVKAFKAGAVLMALRTGAPIIPVYLEKQPHWYNMQRIVVGKPIPAKTYEKGSIPTLKDVEDITQMLHEKETELMKFLKKRS